jgi:hypothetical protein
VTVLCLGEAIVDLVCEELVAAVRVVAALRLRRRVVCLLPGLLLLAGPWYVRNAVFTGNPIFPQGIGVGGLRVFPGGVSPLTVLETSVVDHALAFRWEVLDRWLRLGAELYGPVALLGITGAVVGLVGLRRGLNQRTGLAAFAAFGALAYLNTPFTGGGPDGLDFLMGSNLRYLIPAMLAGVVVASAVMPRAIFALVLFSGLAYGAWRIARGAGFRGDLDFTPLHGASSVAVGLLVAAAVWWPQLRGTRPSVPALMLAAAVSVAALAALVALVALVDARRTPTGLESAIDDLGVRSVTVLGSDDLRSVLGAELDRELLTFSGGSVVEGNGGRSLVGQPIADPVELSHALAASRAEVLVVRGVSVAVPDGWAPPEEEWELAGRFEGGDLYTRSNRDPTGANAMPESP